MLRTVRGQTTRFQATSLQKPKAKKVAIKDVLSDYPVVADRHERKRANAVRFGHAKFPTGTKEPARALKVLNSQLWKNQDWEAIQLMDDTRFIWGQESFDGTSVEWTCTHVPFTRQPLKRRTLYNSILPADK